MIEPFEFLKEYGRVEKETDNVNYKHYEDSNVVNSISVKEALNELNTDIKEMIDFTLSYGLSAEQSTEATYNIWKKHLVVFN